jgi:hypothetical protein
MPEQVSASARAESAAARSVSAALREPVRAAPFGTTGIGGSAAILGASDKYGLSGSTGSDTLSSEEDRLLRLYIGNVQFSDSLTVGSLTTPQTASPLYRSVHKRAAKELLCEQREAYETFPAHGDTLRDTQ